MRLVVILTAIAMTTAGCVGRRFTCTEIASGQVYPAHDPADYDGLRDTDIVIMDRNGIERAITSVNSDFYRCNRPS